MKVALAARYRGWMFALAPATFGLGTVALWLRSRNWPLMIDETGVRLRSHRHVNWASITKLSISRSYLDGHVSRVRLHHATGITEVPIKGLENGQSVADAMIFMFKRTNEDEDKDLEELTDGIAFPNLRAAHGAPPDNPLPTSDDLARTASLNGALDFESAWRGAVRSAKQGESHASEQSNRQEQT